MNLIDLNEKFWEYVANGGFWLFIILTLVQISPIKINPWSKIASAIGKSLNKEITDEVKELKSEVAGLRQDVTKIDSKVDENSAIDARARILRFGDEVSHGINHSRDHFQEVMADITFYNQYCDDHKDFKNNMTKITSKRIEEDYLERDKNDDFL